MKKIKDVKAYAIVSINGEIQLSTLRRSKGELLQDYSGIKKEFIQKVFITPINKKPK